MTNIDCRKCDALAANRRAVRAEDWEQVKFITATAPRDHAPECGFVTIHPLFEVFV
jgi:hypothetical protein